jgi:hypothetical protein
MKWLATIALALLSAGCPCDVGYPGFDSDFEYCNDTCGWSASGTGELRHVETIHPGEHGVELSGSITISHATQVTGGDYYNDGQWIEYVSNCRGPVRVEVVTAPQGGYELIVTLPPGHTSSTSYEYEYDLVHVTVPPIEIEQYSTYTLSGIAIKNQSGRCVIDQVRIMTPAEC